jgi:hypothetical protein
MNGVRHVWLPSTAYIFPDRRQERIGEKVTGLGVLEISGEDYRVELVSPPEVRQHNLSHHLLLHAATKAAVPDEK